MNLQQLRYLRETIRRGLNLTAAAEALHTSQPGLSKAIRDLEDELGVTIFVRHGRRLTAITEEGRHVATIVDRLLLEADNLKRTSRDWRDGESGELRVAATHTQARYALPPAVARLRMQYPRVKVRLHQGSPSQIVSMLRNGQVDLGIATEALDQHADLETQPLFEWHHCALAPLTHPLAAHQSLTLADLAEHDLVTYDPEFAGRNKIDQAFQAAGLTPRIVLEATDADVIKTYVRLGLGVGLVSELAIGDDDRQGMKVLPLDHVLPANTTRIAFRRGHMLRGYERVFIDWLSRHDAAAALPVGEGLNGTA